MSGDDRQERQILRRAGSAWTGTSSPSCSKFIATMVVELQGGIKLDLRVAAAERDIALLIVTAVVAAVVVVVVVSDFGRVFRSFCFAVCHLLGSSESEFFFELEFVARDYF